MEAPSAQFLDVPTLLERSQPRPREGWFWYGMGIFLIVVLLSAYLSMQSSGWAQVINVASPLIMMLVVGAMVLTTWLVARRRREEILQLEAVEELVQLRRWSESAALLQTLLSRPTQTPQARAQGLIYLASVLARYERFEDAMSVYNHLLDNIEFDPGTDFGLRLGRAMSMLRADHLFDADGAISELRRRSPGASSGGLALVEIYRDVKTGHPEEAIKRFDESLDSMRDQLGHRVADAYALVARAYDILGQTVEAQSYYEKATGLSSPAELHRRYPELAPLAQKYRCAEAPVELM